VGGLTGGVGDRPIQEAGSLAGVGGRAEPDSAPVQEGGRERFADLAVLCELRGLKVLALDRTPLTDGGLRAISGFAPLTRGRVALSGPSSSTNTPPTRTWPACANCVTSG
jgi:hypothetical protein